MKKKVLLILLAVVLALSLGIVGCAGEQEEEEEEEPEVYELIFSNTAPELSPPGQAWVQWANMVEEETDGRVKFTSYYAGSLFSIVEVFEGVKAGVADIGFYIVGVNPGLMPLSEAATLPFLNIPSQQAAGDIFQEMQELPEVAEELQGLKLLSCFGMPPYQLHTVNKEVRVPADIEGMSIASAEGQNILVLQSAGAVPVEIATHEVYVALETGLVEGDISHTDGQNVFGLLPLTPFHTFFGEAGMSMAPALYLMNPDSWNALPTDIQEIIEELAPSLGELSWQMTEAADLGAIQEAEGMGHTMTYLTEEEINLWYEQFEPYEEEWITDREDMGLPAREVVEYVKQLVAAYEE